MQNNPQQNSPGTNPKQEHDPGHQKKIGVSETKKRVRKFLIYYFFSSLFFGLASFLISWDRSFSRHAIVCLAIFFVLAAFGVRLQLINHGSIHKKATRWWWIVVVPGVGLCAYLFWWESQAKGAENTKPHLKLSLKFPDFPDSVIDLTNRLLFFDLKSQSREVKNFLAIPVPTDRAKIRLRFSVLNDSSIVVDGFQVFVSYENNLECSKISDWLDGGSRSGTAHGPMKGVAMSENRVLLPNDGSDLPDLVFSPVVDWLEGTDFPLMLVRVGGKNVQPAVVGFKLICLTNFIKPKLHFPTNFNPLVIPPG
jgi:hypothetical protein